ncbi:claudin-10-like isoform X2 [Syngnathoides biaculeatus]|uniref:claudin-10-like isoform X2 n=1 Tax=Syngnathoides biaculeatus TaxID=300417 RepID=UPI002ADE80C7|nr:claudin-10-like isoform X2 [Syngnathoides biaculeatus]
MSTMATEIVGFFLTVSGWILVSSTLPADYWKVSSVDGTVITTATFWSNLWKTCVTDSTGVSNCKDFPSMLALDAYIQVCRGLMIAAVFLGFLGATLALLGMKCTRVGGSETTKARLAVFAGFQFILCGLCCATACSIYAHRITTDFFDPLFVAQNCLMSVTGLNWEQRCSSAGPDLFYASWEVPFSVSPCQRAQASGKFTESITNTASAARLRAASKESFWSHPGSLEETPTCEIACQHKIVRACV